MINEMCDDICDDIFANIQYLRKAKEEATKAMKHRAFNDLLTRLKESGISTLRSTIPTEMKQMSNLLRDIPVSAPFPAEICSDLQYSSASPASIVEKAEGYYWKCVAELTQLRTQVAFNRKLYANIHKFTNYVYSYRIADGGAGLTGHFPQGIPSDIIII
jgi:hypothetical protein